MPLHVKTRQKRIRKYFSRRGQVCLFELDEPLSKLPRDDRSTRRTCAQPAANAVGEENGESEPHCGTLKIDVTCCEAEMRYPTDYNLIDDVSRLIDSIVRQVCTFYHLTMPHTRRDEARRAFLRLARKKCRRRLANSVKLMQLRCLHADIQTFLDIFGKHTGKLLTAVKGRNVKWLRWRSRCSSSSVPCPMPTNTHVRICPFR